MKERMLMIRIVSMLIIVGCCNMQGEKVLAATQADMIVETAYGQCGVQERSKDSDDIKYNDEFYGHRVANKYSGQYSWCAVFVWWCAKENNIPESVIPKKASSLAMRDTMIKNGGTKHLKSSGYKPVKGDIFFFDYGNGHGHVGIVDHTEGDKFYCIEGNYTDMDPHGVHYSKRELNDSRLWGFVTPKYSGKQDNQKPTISNVKITDITKSSYTVSCTVTDNEAVDRVQFPTWTEKNGQDDITKGWETAASCKGSKSGNTYTYTVKRSAHNNEYGAYITHIYAYDKAGNSTSYVVPNVNMDKPASPKIKKAKANGTSSVTVEWEGVSGADEYRIDRRQAGNDTSYETIKTVSKSTLSFKDTNLKAGTRYYYRVYAKNVFGYSEKQDGYSAYTVPNTPAIKNVSMVNTSKLTVSWNKVTGASSYIISRRKSGTDDYKEVKTVSDTSFTDTGLEAGTGYWYKIYAVNDGGKSGASDGGYGMTKCLAPVVTVKNAAGLSIKWNGVVGKTSYQYALYRKGPTDSDYKKITTTTATSYNDSGLSGNKKYSYKIIVLEKDSTVQATYSDEGAGTTAAIPAAPVIKISNQDKNSIAVSWGAVNYASKYQVYRKAEGESSYKLLSTTASTSYTDKTVVSGKKYTYCVKSVNEAGSSGNSNELSIYAVLPAPSSVSCTAKSATSIEVKWSAVKGADGYLVRRRKDGDSEYEVILTCTESNVTSFVDNGLAPSTKYYYKVRTWTGNQISDVSDYGKATTLSSTSATLESPVVKLEAKDTTTINVSWKSVSGATKYEVYRRLAGEDYPAKPTYTTTSTSVSDKGLSAGTRYWYRVYAVNSKQKSTKQGGVMCYTYPSQPKVTVETVSTSSLKASWSGVKGASYYILNIRKSGDEAYETVTTTESTSYVVGGLNAGTTYYFRVYAVVSDKASYITKLTSEKPAGVGGTTKYDPATCAHSYGAWTVTKQASCTESGSRYRVCSKCSNKNTEKINATGHDYSSDWRILKNATCEEDGSKCLVCKKCGGQSNITVIKATGHHYEAGWVTEKEAACTSEGTRYHKCSTCGEKEYETIPVSEHKYEMTGYKNPTVYEEGYMEYVCISCKDTYKEMLEKLPEQPVTDVLLNINNLVFGEIGGMECLAATIIPEDATNAKVNWSSSDESVVAVDENGVVTAVAGGEAAIVVQTEDGGYIDICEVIVDASDGDNMDDKFEEDKEDDFEESEKDISERPEKDDPEEIEEGDSEESGKNDSKEIEEDDSEEPGKDDSKEIEEGCSEEPGKDDSKEIEEDDSEEPGKDDSKEIEEGDSEESGKDDSQEIEEGDSAKPENDGFEEAEKDDFEEAEKDGSDEETISLETVEVVQEYKSSTNTVQISWDSVSGADGYEVYRYNPSTGKWAVVGTVSGYLNTSYKDKKLTAGVIYKYKICAFKNTDNQKEYGGLSEEISTAAKPKKLSITKCTKASKTITISWKKVSCTGYVIQKYNKGKQSWETVKKLKNSKRTYKLKKLKPRTQYKLRVCAYRNDGNKNIYGAWKVISAKMK